MVNLVRIVRFVILVSVTAVICGCAATADQSGANKSQSSSSNPVRIGSTEPTPEAGQANAPPDEFASSIRRDEVKQFAHNLASTRNLSEPAVLSLLDEARYSATVAKLIAPVASGQPRPPKSWKVYRGRRLDSLTVSQGKAFMQQNAYALNRASERYGVPGHVIAALIGVETLYGKNQGSFRALDALATLAFDYPDMSRPERAAMFRDNLADLIELDLTGKVNARTLKGSYAGAVGIPQFMPSSIKRFAVSADGQTKIDLNMNPADAIMSIANYLVEHGWQRGLPIFVPVQLPPDADKLVDGGLKPTLDWAQLQAAGARFTSTQTSNPAWTKSALGVIDLPEEATGTVEYRTATPNFFALTQYNHSYFYAAAIADLSEALIGH